MKKMVLHKLSLVFLGFVALVAIGGFIVQLDSITGNYSAGGGGRWYYGPQKVQLEPREACIYSGLEPLSPARVVTNEYGTVLSVCKQNGVFVTIPLVQTVVVR